VLAILGITGAPRRGKVGHSGAGKWVTRLFWVRAAVGPAPTERPELGPAVAARPGQVGRVSGPTLESGICSAVIIPMRQQPGPMLIFRLTEDRRS
jgi:hypothetical protein